MKSKTKLIDDVNRSLIEAGAAIERARAALLYAEDNYRSVQQHRAMSPYVGSSMGDALESLRAARRMLSRLENERGD